MLRTLVTGRGSIARRHVQHLRALVPNAEVAVVSRSGEVDPALQPCQVVSDFEQGMRWKPDSIIIASVSSRHGTELASVVARGLPCLAEKPVVVTRAELAALRKVHALAPAVPVQVGCNLRHLPALARLRARLAAGEVGPLARAHLEVGQHLSQWRPSRELAATYSADAAQGGGVVFDLVHEIDMARWLLGPLSVRAAAGAHRSSLPVNCDDVHVALLVSQQGVPATVSLDYVSRQSVRRYVFVGESGTVTCDLRAGSTSLADASGERIVDTQGFDIAATYRDQMAEWLAAITGPGRALTCDLADALDTADLMLDLQEAAR